MFNATGNPFAAFASAMNLAQQMSQASLGNQMNPFAAFLAASMTSGMNPAMMNAAQQLCATMNVPNQSGDAPTTSGPATGGQATVPPATGKGKNRKRNKKFKEAGQTVPPRGESQAGSQISLNAGTVLF